MRTLVCGGRDYYGYNKLKDILEGIISDFHFLTENQEVTIIAGVASGADFLAKVFALDEYCENSWLHYKEYPADWKKHGKAAGGIRNQQMLDEGKPDMVIAFPGGNGTADMVRRARKAGITVIEVAG